MRPLAGGLSVMERLGFCCVRVALILLIAAVARADHVTLRNGTVIEGESVAITSMADDTAGNFDSADRPNPNRLLLIDQDYRRYIVSLRQVEDVLDEQEIISYDYFELPQDGSSARFKLFSIGLPKEITPFDKHGVRTVTLTGPGNRPMEIVQGITRIGPDYVTVEGVNQKWWQGLATKAFPDKKLIQLIRSAIDTENPDDRLALARFLIRAERYEPAVKELDKIARDFPELEARVGEMKRELNQLRARWLLSQVGRRREAGQHRLAMGIADAFPAEEDFNAEILRQVKTLRDEYDSAREQADKIIFRLGELEAEIDDPEQRATAAEIRREVARLIDWESISRFDAFLTLADDNALPAADKLALAYSGWMTGSAQAITDFPQTLRLWEARWLVSEYLKSEESARRAELLAELKSLEAIGPGQISSLLRFIAPWRDQQPIPSLRATLLETAESVPGWGGDAKDGKTVLTSSAGPVRYAAVLPSEYRPTKAYPLLVAMRPAEWSIKNTAQFWGARNNSAGGTSPGPATQRGYIVIAPEYADADQVTYNYSAREHRAVRAAIRDAKKRFLIDSNRVYLAGHGMGGDATFDLAFSQLDLFAGAAPISGLFRQQILFEKQSSPRVPLYLVNGELDRNARGKHGEDLAYMMNRGHDIIYCEYAGRGYEHYAGELENILDWMGRLQRAADPREIDAQIARTSDTRHYWLTAEAIPSRFFLGRATRDGRVPNPLELEGRISAANTITLRSPAERYQLRLNADLVNLEERVKIKAGGRQKFNDFLEPQIADLLENFETTGDRQRLYPIRLTIE